MSAFQMHLVGERNVLISRKNLNPEETCVTLSVRSDGTEGQEPHDNAWGPADNDDERWTGAAFTEVCVSRFQTERKGSICLLCCSWCPSVEHKNKFYSFIFFQKHMLPDVLDFEGCHVCKISHPCYPTEAMYAHFQTSGVREYFRGHCDLIVEAASFSPSPGLLGGWFRAARTDHSEEAAFTARLHFTVPRVVVSQAVFTLISTSKFNSQLVGIKKRCRPFFDITKVAIDNRKS